MNDAYLSLLVEGSGRYEEKKSVFLSFAKPVSSEQQAQEYLNRIRSQYPDARHHVYAYVLREGNKTRYSDDGEPSGTGGMPVLDLLRKEGVTDAIIVVVRYFGGTLLGTGGLVRAYTVAAKDAIQSAFPIIYRPADILKLRLSYPDYTRVTTTLHGVLVMDTSFEDDVSLTVQVQSTDTVAFLSALSAQTSGRCVSEIVGKTFCGDSNEKK